MKLSHHVPNRALEPHSAELTPEYQAEVDRTMAHAEVEYRRAEKRLRAAERRLTRARAAESDKKQRKLVAHLEVLVQLRRLEMERTHRMMTTVSAPSTSRGKKSYRNVPGSTPL